MATYNLVNSVKGGCGKTTFSIWLTYYLNNMSEEEEKKNTALLIDMDLLGTSMQVVIKGNARETDEKEDSAKKDNEKKNNEKENDEVAYTNDIFNGVKNSRKSFVQKIKLKNDVILNIIMANMKVDERDKFKSGRYSGYAPTVRHSIFRAGVQELIKANKTIDGKEVKHFIFDMPPNSDGFSDTAMECIFSKKYSNLNDKDKKNLFIMIGSDLGQTVATQSELKMLLDRSDEMMPDRIFIVFNHNSRGEMGEDGYLIRKQKIEKIIRNSKLKESEKNSIYFLKMCNGDEYAKLGIGNKDGGKGLQNAEPDRLNDVLPKTVISAYAKYEDQEFTEIIDERKLLKLVLGEEQNEATKDESGANA